MVSFLRRRREEIVPLPDEKTRWNQEQDQLDAWTAELHRWQAIYRRLRALLPEQDQKDIRPMNYSPLSSVPDAYSVGRLKDARRQVQELFWLLERRGIVPHNSMVIQTPEDVQRFLAGNVPEGAAS